MINKIKISNLPPSQSLQDLYTIGTDAKNRSVKVPVQALTAALEAHVAELDVRTTPIEIGSEEEMQELVNAGRAKDNTLYYVPEDE